MSDQKVWEADLWSHCYRLYIGSFCFVNINPESMGWLVRLNLNGKIINISGHKEINGPSESESSIAFHLLTQNHANNITFVIFFCDKIQIMI